MVLIKHSAWTKTPIFVFSNPIAVVIIISGLNWCHERKEEGNEGEKVDKIHQAKEELDLPRACDQSDEILDQEEDDHDVLRDVDDVHDVD